LLSETLYNDAVPVGVLVIGRGATAHGYDKVVDLEAAPGHYPVEV
jgi:hypothetical protein